MSAARPASEVRRRAVIAATVRVSTWSQSTYTDQCRYDPEVLARATACSVHGLAGVPVMVEADVANGLPSFSVVEPMGVAGGRGGLFARSALCETAARP